MAVIEETLQVGVNMKAPKRKLDIGKDRIYALKGERGHITHNVDKTSKVAELFYTRL